MSDTQAQLLRSQQEEIRRVRGISQQCALETVDHYRQRDGWGQEEYEEILGALGLLPDQQNVPALGHEDPKRSRRGGMNGSGRA